MTTQAKIIEDGEILRVPLVLMDGVQRSIAAQQPINHEGHDPYSSYKRQLADQWRGGDDEPAACDDIR